ncbi:MAG: prephenate dehydrogenase/arogenate dehydrogenase family protein [Lachnospiraceae bacterium]
MSNKDIRFRNIGFIGLGLIGGSVAMAVRRAFPKLPITAWNRNPAVLEEAVADGTVTVADDGSFSSFAACDLVFLCVPVITAVEMMKKLEPILAPGAILTDVGSVKGDIHRKVEGTPLDWRFIGGHPMAGSEKTGYENASAQLLENAWYFLTPAGNTDVQKVSDLSELISAIGALPLVMTSEEHDYVTAAISHFPHVLSAALVNLVRDLDLPGHPMKTVAAGGFRDITRISSSSPQMWQEICLANPKNICRVLDAYMQKLIDYRLAVSNGDTDALYEIFRSCKEYRDSFDALPHVPMFNEYRLFVEIADETGSLAKITALLSDAGISIRNLSIINNREYEQGSLKIAFGSEETRTAASKVLSNAGYTVHGIAR